MSRRCSVSGKGPLVGNNVSHANNKTTLRTMKKKAAQAAAAN
ncbi:MAG: hypothetical protein B5M46_04505 [Epsilonproteobacteria bacterium 4484_20]|nr:MAG: hypothetical protein B5M46_04505 [Epsilonproteobacteria bacterium 4484_20]